MEHSRIKKRNVALIEKCVMTGIGMELIRVARKLSE